MATSRPRQQGDQDRRVGSNPVTWRGCNETNEG